VIIKLCNIIKLHNFTSIDKKRIVQVANAKTVKLGEALNEAESDHQNDVGITESIQPSAEAPAGIVIYVFYIA
jgi:hypothetical protein